MFALLSGGDLLDCEVFDSAPPNSGELLIHKNSQKSIEYPQKSIEYPQKSLKIHRMLTKGNKYVEKLFEDPQKFTKVNRISTKVWIKVPNFSKSQ